MSKQSYAVRVSLNRSFADKEVPLSGNIIIMVKVVLFWLVSTLLLFWMLFSTWVADSSLWIQALFVLVWLSITALFGNTLPTREMRFTMVPALLSYIPATSRRVVTRRNSNPGNFYSVLGIRDIRHDGVITWLDGTVGQAFLVVGSSSMLLFKDDRDAILDRVDSFWRRTDIRTQFIFLTTKEAQRVALQLAALERRNVALDVRDPELFVLLDEQYTILKDFVGGQFNSIHQYLVIKSEDMEAFRRASATLRSEVDESGLMIKQCTTLDRRGAVAMLRSVYTASAT